MKRGAQDLGRLNRDLKKVICIDCDPRAVSDYPRNLLLVPRWTGDDEDTALVDLAELLKGKHVFDKVIGLWKHSLLKFYVQPRIIFAVILSTKPDDVRPVLEYYSQFDDPAKHFREASAELVCCFASRAFLKPNTASDEAPGRDGTAGEAQPGGTVQRQDVRRSKTLVLMNALVITALHSISLLSPAGRYQIESTL